LSARLVPSDDAITEMYEEAVATLETAGLKQYEISNFAQPGMESKHNLRYWQRRPYLGVGLDASSMLYSSEASDEAAFRCTTTDDLKEYLSSSSTTAETSWLGPAQQLEEAWFLGLRRNLGVDLKALRREFGARPVEPSIAVAKRLADDGLLTIEGNRVCLNSRGRLISNDVFGEFLGLGTAQESEREAAAAN
jgi:oxygen-independent coproporphyrinogen-3 oxidase